MEGYFNDPRVIGAQAMLAREYNLDELSADSLRGLAEAYRRFLQEVVSLLDELWITPRSTPTDRERRRVALLAEVPDSQRAEDRDGDQADAAASIIADIDDGTAGAVMWWLRAARTAGLNADQRETLRRMYLDALSERDDSECIGCPDCIAADSDLCAVHEADFVMAERYHQLAVALGVAAGESPVGEARARARARAEQRD